MEPLDEDSNPFMNPDVWFMSDTDEDTSEEKNEEVVLKDIYKAVGDKHKFVYLRL